jgi:hypothetical protein
LKIRVEIIENKGVIYLEINACEDSSKAIGA